MRRRLFVLLALSLLPLMVAASVPAEEPLSALLKRLSRGEMARLKVNEQPKTLKDVTFMTLEGEARKLSYWRGKVVLLNAWATWCGACKAEMASLNALQRQLGDEEFEVLAFSVDEDLSVAKAFFDRYKLDRLHVHGGNIDAIGEALDLPGVPYSLLINRQGREVARLRGSANWAAWEAVLLVKAMIQQK